MTRPMCAAIVGSMLVMLAGCAPDENVDDGIQASLFISNQSVDVDSIPIHVELDGVGIVDADFPAVGPDGGIPQHYWVRYDFSMSAGEHYLTASTDGTDGAAVSETLATTGMTPGDTVYLVLDFSGTSAETGTLSLQIPDSEPMFQ